MLLSDIVERRRKEADNRKLYYMLKGMEERREHIEALEVNLMRRVQKVKFGSTNYGD